MGLFWSALGFGMLLASLSIAFFKPRNGVSSPKIALLALALGGMAVEALAFVHVRAAAAALMIIIGWSAAAFNPIVISLLQVDTPEGLRARVMTAFNSATMAAALCGMTGFGWVADHLGGDASMRGIGGVLLMTALSLMLVTRLPPARALLQTVRSSETPNHGPA